MSTTTPNYNLTKPGVNDNYDVEIVNANMDKIDAQMKTNADETANKIPKDLASAANQFLVSSALGTWVVKTVAEIKTLLGLGSAAYEASSSFAAASHNHTKSQISDFPSAMTPSAHKSTHATGGSDALTASDIGAAKRFTKTATLAVASWTGSAAPYTYELTDADILAIDQPHVDRVTGTDAAAAALINTAWSLITGYAVKPQTSAGKITFYATAKPSVALPIMYEVVRT